MYEGLAPRVLKLGSQENLQKRWLKRWLPIPMNLAT